MVVTDEQGHLNSKVGAHTLNQEILKESQSDRVGRQLLQHSYQMQTVKATQAHFAALLNQMQQNFNTLVKQLRDRLPEGSSLLSVEKNMETLMKEVYREILIAETADTPASLTPHS